MNISSIPFFPFIREFNSLETIIHLIVPITISPYKNICFFFLLHFPQRDPLIFFPVARATFFTYNFLKDSL
ncbi:MAG: hypothetical protein B6D37_06145 [Sphingobacteriales bacterium UTBCD1]|nr:MAG: hypothetical protein B6D37_06145 [Sphingobacteriales bacterium UTBCD1]